MIELTLLGYLGLVAIHQGNYQTALHNLKEVIPSTYETGGWSGVTHGFAGLALLASFLGTKAGFPSATVQQDYLTRAARLSGIIAGLLSNTGSGLGQPERHYYEQAQEIARAGLGEAAFTAAFAQGQAMPPEQIMEYVLSMEIITLQTETPSIPAPITLPPTSEILEKLTNRELEVLRLVAAGLTDPQIAEQLTLSPRTVHAHLRTIFGKIEVTTRSAATRYAIEHKLV